MMTIEQFRSPELSRLYTERYITRVVRYHVRDAVPDGKGEAAGRAEE